MAKVKKLQNPGGGQEIAVMVGLWQKFFIKNSSGEFCADS